MTRPVVYCTDSAYLTASAAPRPAGGTYLRIDLAIGQPMNSCSAEAMRPRMPDEIPFPTLVAPAGTTSSNGYMGGSTFGREASTLLETDITPAGLISHYSTQLKAAGWTVRESTGSITSAVIQIVEMKNSKGRLLTGILTAVALSKPRTRDVSFEILSPDSPRFFQ